MDLPDRGEYLRLMAVDQKRQATLTRITILALAGACLALLATTIAEISGEGMAAAVGAVAAVLFFAVAAIAGRVAWGRDTFGWIGILSIILVISYVTAMFVFARAFDGWTF